MYVLHCALATALIIAVSVRGRIRFILLRGVKSRWINNRDGRRTIIIELYFIHNTMLNSRRTGHAEHGRNIYTNNIIKRWLWSPYACPHSNCYARKMYSGLTLAVRRARGVNISSRSLWERTRVMRYVIVITRFAAVCEHCCVLDRVNREGDNNYRTNSAITA